MHGVKKAASISMAEAGSFAERVKQQADIVRVIGEYVRLKKSGQNFLGLCPFHQEKTPSFAVHPLKQIYLCFGCGVGGDVFQFVMETEKCAFPEAVRTVAEKCGIPVPQRRPLTPSEEKAHRWRPDLLEIHSYATDFFIRQLNETTEGKVARAYLEERGLDAARISEFRLGYAPSSGDALHRHLRGRAEGGIGYGPDLLESSGLILKGQSGQFFDRFRRRIMFPIANESGKVVAFGGRAMGDDMPKYMNSPGTSIYSKSNVLYHLDRAKEAVRQNDFAVLVEGYMDAIALAQAGFANVVASCGTSLAEPQAKLLGRFTRRIIVNYDPDAAGRAATERSLSLLLEKEFDVRVLALPDAADPDKFIRDRGAEAYGKLLAQAPPYLEYLIGRARQMDRSTAAGKLAAVNYLMPYVQRVPNRLLRSEWATRIASELRVEEPVLREALRKAAAERRSEVKPKEELLAPAVKPAERRLLQMLVEAEGFRERLAREMTAGELCRGLETEKLFEALLTAVVSGQRMDPGALAEKLGDRDRRLLMEILFEPSAEAGWEEAQSCLAALRGRQIQRELAEVQRMIESKPSPEELRRLLARKQELHKHLAGL